jgi:hypothetical protein
MSGGFDEERFLNHQRHSSHGMPVKRDKDGLYYLSNNYLVEYKQDQDLFHTYGSASPTSLIPGQGNTPIEFTELGDYIAERDAGKNEFGKAYVEAVYSGLMKVKKGAALSVAAGYDKFFLEEDMVPMTQRVQEFYANNIFNKIGEVEGLGPVLVETMVQYMIPYLGARKLMGKLVGTPAISSIFNKTIKNAKANKIAKDTIIGTGAIGGMSAVAVSPGDENALKFIAETTGLPEGESETLYNNMYEYFTDVEDATGGADADAVIREKVRGFYGDLPMEAAFAGIIEGFKLAGKGLPAVKTLGTLLLLTKTLQETKNLNVEQLERLQEAATMKE